MWSTVFFQQVASIGNNVTIQIVAGQAAKVCGAAPQSRGCCRVPSAVARALAQRPSAARRHMTPGPATPPHPACRARPARTLAALLAGHLQGVRARRHHDAAAVHHHLWRAAAAAQPAAKHPQPAAAQHVLHHGDACVCYARHGAQHRERPGGGPQRRELRAGGRLPAGAHVGVCGARHHRVQVGRGAHTGCARSRTLGCCNEAALPPPR